MSLQIQSSVVLITSQNPQNSRFGTGFVIYHTTQNSYLLTCAHVIDDVGGVGTVDMAGHTAEVVAIGSAAGLDLAVLKVTRLTDSLALPLKTTGQKGDAFQTAGFQQSGKYFLMRPLQGILGETVRLMARGQTSPIKAWDLKIEGDDPLQPGYSGSPVVDEASGQVLGVVSHRQGSGERGLAVSVEALPQIWPDMPVGLLSAALPVAKEAIMSPPPPINQGISLFFSYAHEDEILRDELAKHLSILRRQHIISNWYDRDITAGSEWANEIDSHLNQADIILLLISADFMASDYCYDVEMSRAMERHEQREAVVIPVILRKTKWQNAPFSKLQALPKNGKPVTGWADQDEAFLNIAEGIQRVAEMYR